MIWGDFVQDESSSNLIYQYRYPTFRSECDIDPVPFDYFMKYYVFDDIEQELQKERLLKLLEAGRTIRYEGKRTTIAFENFDLVLEETE